MNKIAESSTSSSAQAGLDMLVYLASTADKLKREGRPVINMCKGELDLDTPEHVKEAGIRAIRDGDTKYTSIGGTAVLKEAVAEKLWTVNQLNYSPDEILISGGAKQGLYNFFRACLDPGQEAILLAPYWSPYLSMLRGRKAMVTIVRPAEGALEVTAESLEPVLTSQSKLIVLNSPNNPSGQAYDRRGLEQLAELFLRYPDLMIAADEVYEATRFDGITDTLLNVCPELRDRVLVVHSFSKSFSMSGWRIGYSAGSATLIARLTRIQLENTFNACSISQAAAVAALRGPQDFVNNLPNLLRQRHDRLLAALRRIPGISCAPSKGTFYLFPNISGLYTKLLGVNSDADFARYLLDAHAIAAVPGAAFGIEHHIRLCFSIDEAELDATIASLEETFGA